VRLLPLLGGRLVVGRVEIEGLDVSLVKNAAGQGNWEGFGRSPGSGLTPEPAAGATRGSAPGPAPAPARGRGNPGEALTGIAGIQITDARVRYQAITLQHIKIETGSFAEHGEVPVTLHVDADRGVAGEQASVDARFDLRADSGARRYTLSALSVTSEIALAGHVRAEPLSVSAPRVDLDLAAQTLAAAAVAVNFAGAQVGVSLQGTHVLDAPALTATVTVAPLVVRETLARLGIPVPAMRDPKAMSLAAAAGSFAYGGDIARVDHLEATVDDTHTTGSAQMNLTTHAIAFDLAVDTVDLDRYMPPAAANSPPTGPQPAVEAAPSTPVEANGTLALGALHVSALDLSAVKVTVATHEKVMRFFPLTAQVDGGRYSGDITLDTRGATPAVSLDEHLSGIDVGKLTAKGAKKVHLTGHGNVNLKASGHGAGAVGILKTLEGHLDTNIMDGAVEGVDMGYEMGRAEALLRRQDAPAAPNTQRTVFQAFKMSAEISHGIASTKDLLISSAALKITGQGSANLPAGTLDLSLLADTGKTAANLPIQIPLKVTGSLADPTVRPDANALAKGELKQKVKDALQDKLKSLFGKP
ncbi:MAG: AsmA-like C-terminal region-containing protein, partial [Steroidobacteraceae bacterium]